MTRCPQCGQENRAEARFCDACGTSLLGAPTLREERKVVTVLFADLVGFTATAELLDPEDVRALQDPYWRHVRTEIERHGGTVEKFIGDAVVGLFGAPVAHEDDPERAVRAALAIRDWAVEEVDLQLRMAVNTGEALVALAADSAAGEGMASGDVINVASRLQSAAPVNGILVGEATYRATRDVIDYCEWEAVEAKGKAVAVQAWQPVAPRSAVGVVGVHVHRTPLVGRGQEVALLLSIAERVRADREPQLVTLVGVPGIGKSRLTVELCDALAADASMRWRQGRCLPYGDGVAFWPIGEIVKSHAEILEGDTSERAEAKLRAAVTDAIGDPAEAEWTVRHLRPLLGISAVDADFGRRSQADVFAAWRRFFEALAEHGPLVLVVEDLHWADEELLDFIDHLVDWAVDAPILVFCTARPELLERRPGWGGGKANATTLSLWPLSDEDTARLLAANLDRVALEPDLKNALLERAGGNPLYTEQYARMLAERAGPDEQLAIPETVQAIVAARLDGLSREEKELLHAAAVHGKVFWAGAVSAMGAGDRSSVEQHLHGLERKEFVRRQRPSTVAGDVEYAFRHILVRDVAYGQIPRRLRAKKHRLAAEWIEALVKDRECHVEMLAHHYLSALALAGGPDEAMSTRARSALVQAGEHALGVSAFQSAADYYERALQLLPGDDSRRPDVLFGYARALFGRGDDARGDALEQARAELLAAGEVENAAEADALLAEVSWYRGQRRPVDEHLERALALIRERPPSPAKARVLSAVARFRMLADDCQEAIEVAREALTLAESLQLDEVRAQTLITLGSARDKAGDAGGIADVKRGIRVALEANALSAAWRGFNNLAANAGYTGDYTRQIELLREAEQLGRRLGDRQGLRSNHAQLIDLKYRSGLWDDALKEADEFITECELGSPHREESEIRLVRAEIRVARDDDDGASDDYVKALALARDAKDPQAFLSALEASIRINLQLGRHREARKLAAEALRVEPGVAARHIVFELAWEMDLLGLTTDRLHPYLEQLPRTRWRRAAELVIERKFDELADLLAEIGSKDWEAQARLRTAQTAAAEGHDGEVARQLESALAFYRSVGATRYIREAETLHATIQSESEGPAAQPRA